MFSKRLHWDLRKNPLTLLLEAKRAAGVPILDLTESNPTSAGLAYPAQQIVSAFGNPRILYYDPNPAGIIEARQAVSNYYQGEVDPGRILLTTSTSEAYGFLFKLLTDPGDEILAPCPSYPLFEFLAGMELVRVLPYSLRYHGRWEMDFDTIAANTSDRTRAIVIVNPNNPTGSFLRAHELARLIEFTRDRGIALISDEVFSDFGHAGDTERIGSLRDVTDTLTFCLSGLSKVAGLPQMKLGWIVTGGPDQLRKDALTRLELIADTYLPVGTPVQIAAAQLLDAGTLIRQQVGIRTVRNLRQLKSEIDRAPAFRMLNVEGGWYAILQVPRIRSEEEWVLELLEYQNVLVQPGYFYDFESEAFLVVSLLTPEEVFQEGISRVLTYGQKHHA